MLLKEESHRLQSQLTDYCRREGASLPRGVDPNRVSVYRRLIFSNISETLRRAYPIAAHLLEGERWDFLVESFFSEHKIASPYLWQMPKEFWHFVDEGGFSEEWDLPYLDDLLHFEWLEIAVHMMADGESPPYTDKGDPMRDRLIVNPDHSIDPFRYPVFKGSSEEWAARPGNYFLLTYREPIDCTVHYIELSPLCTIIFELLRNAPLSGSDIVEWLVVRQGQNREAMEQFCGIFLRELLVQKVVLGFMME